MFPLAESMADFGNDETSRLIFAVDLPTAILGAPASFLIGGVHARDFSAKIGRC